MAEGFSRDIFLGFLYFRRGLGRSLEGAGFSGFFFLGRSTSAVLSLLFFVLPSSASSKRLVRVHIDVLLAALELDEVGGFIAFFCWYFRLVGFRA